MTISFTSNLGFIKNSFHGAYAKISVYAKMVAVKSILERSAFLELLNLHRKSMKTNENSWHLNEKYSNNVRKKLKRAFLEKIEMIHIFQPSPSLVLCLQYHSRNHVAYHEINHPAIKMLWSACKNCIYEKNAILLII